MVQIIRDGRRRLLAARASSKVRADIQGLRALAVSLVVVYHLWPGKLTGGYIGVDAFFVISGFLITSHLLATPPTGWNDLKTFWSRRIRRLLPASLTVLAVVFVLSRLIAPSTQWAATAKQAVASAFYVQNWVLASDSVDYLASDNPPTPVQHYWSLSVEEQFYVVWPLLLLVLGIVAVSLRIRFRLLALCGVAGVVVVSLLYSIWRTAEEPASAYFVTPTRMWELAVGGLIAFIPSLKARGHLASLIAWAGMTMVVLAGFTFTGGTAFPGYAALLPVGGTALVIWAWATSASSPTAFTAFRPIQWLGDISYSVYLWHWPLIVLLPYVSGGDLGWLDKIAIVVATLILAHVSKVLIEDRFRSGTGKHSVRTAFRFAIVATSVIAIAGIAQTLEVRHHEKAAEQELLAVTSGGDRCLGASAIVSGLKKCPPADSGRVVPDPAVAMDDKSSAYERNCWTNEPFSGRFRKCVYGDGETEVALVGNSHAGHWLPALEVLAERNDWTLTTFLVSRCNPTSAPLDFDTEEKRQNCLKYGRWVIDQTEGDTFDLVITSERQSLPVEGESFESTAPAAEAGYREYLQEWAATGTNLLVIRDVPYPEDSVPECVAQNLDELSVCAGTEESWYWMDPLYDAAKKMRSRNVTALDLSNFFCSNDVCPAVIGGVIVYFDGSHISATYAKTLAPYLQKPIESELR